MKIAITADIHANTEALEKVVDDSRQLGAKKFFFLGDAVGRGPDPVGALLWVRNTVNPKHWVLGNHDAMLGNLLNDAEWELVNPRPKQIIELHRKLVSENPKAQIFIDRKFMSKRISPTIISIKDVKYILVHGGLFDPAGYYRYLYPWEERQFLPDELKKLSVMHKESKMPCVMMVGHTHVPMLVSGNYNGNELVINSIPVLPNKSYHLDPKFLWMVNPGSVGQPRDLDNRASYAILDTKLNTICFRRTEYDIDAAVRKIIALRLPLGTQNDLIEKLWEAPMDKRNVPSPWVDHFEGIRGQPLSDCAEYI